MIRYIKAIIISIVFSFIIGVLAGCAINVETGIISALSTYYFYIIYFKLSNIEKSIKNG